MIHGSLLPVASFPSYLFALYHRFSIQNFFRPLFYPSLSSFRYFILWISRLILLCFFSVVFSFWKFAVPLRIVARRSLICSIRKFSIQNFFRSLFYPSLSSFRYFILYIPRLIFLCFFSVVFSVVFSLWKFAVPLRIVPRRNLICSIRKSVFIYRFFHIRLSSLEF